MHIKLFWQKTSHCIVWVSIWLIFLLLGYILLAGMPILKVSDIEKYAFDNLKETTSASYSYDSVIINIFYHGKFIVVIIHIEETNQSLCQLYKKIPFTTLCLYDNRHDPMIRDTSQLLSSDIRIGRNYLFFDYEIRLKGGQVSVQATPIVTNCIIALFPVIFLATGKCKKRLIGENL